MSTDAFLTVGVMTGNSLDGADTVLTVFSADGTITDLCQHSKASPPELAKALRELRTILNSCGGDTEWAEREFNKHAAESSNGDAHSETPNNFEELSELYINFVASAIKELIEKAKDTPEIKAAVNLDKIDLVGFHGQTCAHYPPSIAKTKDPGKVYTVQLGDGQALADLLGITVVYDFRSDDLMNGGEAAPLAPMHHAHIAEGLKSKGKFPVVFCNAGNTGNLSIVTTDQNGKQVLLGFDCGPCNAFPDSLMRVERGLICDRDGKIGKEGKVNSELLGLLFEKSAATQDGENFLLKPPPKSSDPQWYKIIDELSAKGSLPFEDRLRTAEYFAAYCFYFSLTLLPPEITIPPHYILCGGGWQNPVVKKHMQGLIKGDFKKNPVLAGHLALFKALNKKIKAAGAPSCELSDESGINGVAMEARVFADAAVSRIKGIPFSVPEVTAVSKPTVLGLVRFPNQSAANATPKVRAAFDKVRDLTFDPAGRSGSRWSRATCGWAKISQRL